METFLCKSSLKACRPTSPFYASLPVPQTQVEWGSYLYTRYQSCRTLCYIYENLKVCTMVKVKHVCFWWFHLKTLLYSVNTINFCRGALKYQMPVTWLYHVHDKMNLNWKLVLKSYRIIQYCKQTFICCIYFAIFQL